MAWIKVVEHEEASGLLAQVYSRQAGARGGRLPVSKRLLSLNPQAMNAVEEIRDAFRFGSPNIDARRREMVATVTSALLSCTH